MRVLVGKTFGIGNAALSVPMVKALSSLGHRVDVLVGTGPDDFGAADVFKALRENSPEGTIGNIWKDQIAFREDAYDLAIMSIPYDGRWQNGLHYFARKVIDERRRPGNVERLGFDMWERHEIEYQMDNVRDLGFSGPTPDGSFLSPGVPSDDLVYLGIGYKRDQAGFGLSKHFGNARFAELIREVRRIRPQVRFVSTGGVADLVQTGYQIFKSYSELGLAPAEAYAFKTIALPQSFDVLRGCRAYIGNDTGMMHVAASLAMPTYGLMAYPELAVKNPPFCERSRCLLFTPEQPSVEAIARDFVDFVWGK